MMSCRRILCWIILLKLVRVKTHTKLDQAESMTRKLISLETVICEEGLGFGR